MLSILFLFIPGSVIVWDYFLRLYEWSNIESISICKKLTNEHMYPNDRLKMRNHLAEEVLDEEMLQNFKVNIYYYTTKCYQLTTSKSSLSVVTLSRRKEVAVRTGSLLGSFSNPLYFGYCSFQLLMALIRKIWFNCFRYISAHSEMVAIWHRA